MSKIQINYKIGSQKIAELVNNILFQAIKNRAKPQIIHTVMDIQYIIALVEQTLKNLKIRHSYSLKGYLYDNT